MVSLVVSCDIVLVVMRSFCVTPASGPFRECARSCYWLASYVGTYVWYIFACMIVHVLMSGGVRAIVHVNVVARSVLGMR